MNNKSLRFKVVDWLLIALMILPLVAGIALKVLTTPASDGIEITGARVYWEFPMPLQQEEHPAQSLHPSFAISLLLYNFPSVKADKSPSRFIVILSFH